MTEHVLSPSQIDAYQRCPRRWGYTHLQGKKEPGTKAALAGTKIHELLENYLRDATPIDESITWEGYEIGKIAADMTQHLPPAGSIQTVEQTLDLEVDGIKYRGRVDAKTDDTVYDHKSVSNLKNAKSVNKLKTDIQALIYARWLGKDGFLQWTSGQTVGTIESKKTRLPIVYEEVVKRFDEIVTPIAKEMLAAVEKNEPSTLRRDKNGCFLFPPKGCPHKIYCKIEEDKQERRMGLVDLLKAGNKVEPERAAVVAEHVKAIASLQEAQVGEPTLLSSTVKFDPINSPEGQALRSTTPTPPAPIVVDTLPKKPRKKREAVTAEVNPEAKQEVTIHVALDQLSAESQALEAIDDTKSKTPDTDKPIRTLFVGAIPLNKPVKFAHDFISKAAQTVENDLEIHHVLLAPYSTGGASLAAQLRSDILALGESDFDLVLMNRSPEGRAIEQTLMSLAQNVVVSL